MQMTPRLDSLVLEGAIHTIRGEKEPSDSPAVTAESYGSCQPGKDACGCNSDESIMG